MSRPGATATTEPTATAGAHPLVSRQIFGLGVLLLAMISGYMASRVTSTHEPAPVVSAPADRDEELAPTLSSVEIDPLIAIDFLIKDVAARYHVSAELVAAIIEAESGFNPRAVSHRGAQGLMQLMPATAARLGVGDPFDPRENIEGGVRHLRSLLDRFDNNVPLAVAAYHAGENPVIRHGCIAPYKDTHEYVSQILERLGKPAMAGRPALASRGGRGSGMLALR
jgi:soluble lytic murein transglycosylase-like protein